MTVFNKKCILRVAIDTLITRKKQTTHFIRRPETHDKRPEDRQAWQRDHRPGYSAARKGYVIEQVEKIAKENELTDIQSVTLEFGEVSGIVPEYLSDCWQWYAKKKPIIEHAEFKYEIIPAITWCDDCKSTYPTVKYGKTCPHCGSGRTWLQQGQEMNIKQIEAC